MAGELLRSHKGEVGEHLELSSMANNAAIGIEYTLRGRRRCSQKMVDDLLQQGISLCSLLLKASLVHGQSSKKGVPSQQVSLYTIFESLASVGKQVGSMSVEDVPKRAKYCRTVLRRVLEEPDELPEARLSELESCRDFLNDVSVPYLECAERGLEEHRRARGVEYI